ncbi:hypothetical protein [Clostridium sp.]|uniref:hypothetical protein n=1 Tax=Clostridium sp. TaxID=1506 RepID=UPI002FC86118
MEISNQLAMTMATLMIIITVCALVNYIFVSLALYKIAKVEGDDKAWLAWVPVGNAYMLIKLGGGKMVFLASFIAAMFLRGFLGTIAMAVFVIYGVYMYSNLCNKYDGSLIPIAIGSSALIVGIFPSLTGLTIPIYLIGLYGQWKLYRSVSRETYKGKKRK